MVVVGILIALLAIIGIVFSRLITTFFHELGHAIPALLFSDGDVEMYVGSYGNPKNTWSVKIGRLNLHTSFNIWELQLGLCAHRASQSTFNTLIIILGGPLMSLILALILLYGLASPQYDDGVKFVMAIFMLSSFFDFIVNIVPREIPIRLHDGSMIYNDGKQFIELFKKSTLPQDYYTALELKDEGKYEKANVLLDKLIENEGKNRQIVELQLDILEQKREYRRLIDTFEEYIYENSLSSIYIIKWADAKLKLHEYDDVIKLLTAQIYNGKNHSLFLDRRAKALIELGEYREAMMDYNAITLRGDGDPIALAYRSYCQFKLGYEEEAKEDIEEAMSKLQNEQPEVFFLAGQIYRDSNEDLALAYYKRARGLGYEHHALDFNISQIEGWKGE